MRSSDRSVGHNAALRVFAHHFDPRAEVHVVGQGGAVGVSSYLAKRLFPGGVQERKIRNQKNHCRIPIQSNIYDDFGINDIWIELWF